MKQSYIIRQIEGWIEETDRNKTPGLQLELEKLLKQLRVEFEALEVPMPAKTTQYSYETYPFGHDAPLVYFICFYITTAGEVW